MAPASQVGPITRVFERLAGRWQASIVIAAWGFGEAYAVFWIVIGMLANRIEDIAR